MFSVDDLVDTSSPLEEEFQLELQLIVELHVNQVCLLINGKYAISYKKPSYRKDTDRTVS